LTFGNLGRTWGDYPEGVCPRCFEEKQKCQKFNAMKSAILCLFLSMVTFMAGPPVSAQVLQVDQFKTALYSQTNSAPPTTPNFPDAYFSGTYIITDPDYSVTNVVVFAPNGGQFDLAGDGTYYFSYGSPFYANETNFDQDFPGGTYDYNYDYTDSASNTYNEDILFDCSTNDLYPAVIPAFTPACWTAMQTVDPARDFTLSWNNYALTPGAGYAYTFLSINDATTGNTVLGPSGPPAMTSTNILAGTLQYGHIYDVSVDFSERQNPSDYGYGDAFITVGWDNLTQATLITLPLWLQIAPAGTNVVLTWAADATSYHLETSASLSPSSTWNVVTNLLSINGTTNVLTLPALKASAFFRLAPVEN
jgi:hypothetical protein